MTIVHSLLIIDVRCWSCGGRGVVRERDTLGDEGALVRCPGCDGSGWTLEKDEV